MDSGAAVGRVAHPAPGVFSGGVEFRFSKLWYARALAARRLGRADWGLAHPPLRWTWMRRRPLLGPGWVRVDVLRSGICGSDLAMLRATLSPALSPFSSFPAVMGHEGAGIIAECGAQSGWHVGDRVVVDPFIGCVARGLLPCPECSRGRPALCRRREAGAFSQGMMLGVCRDLPGLWAQEVQVHTTQLHAIPQGVSMDEAVLVEPLSVAAHAVLAHPPEAGDRVMVVGQGTVGLLTVAALRIFGFGGPVLAVCRHPVQRAAALTMGATDTVLEAETADELCRGWGAKVHQAVDGRPVLSGTLDVVFDATGAAGGLHLALGATRPGGRVVLVGSPGVLRRLDATPLWSREITLEGSMAYGSEPGYEGAHTFDLVLSRLQKEGSPPVERIITHRWPLRKYREALFQMTGGPKDRPLKAVFHPFEDGPSEDARLAAEGV